MRFNRSHIKAYLQLDRSLTKNQETTLRIDIVNVGGKPGTLKKITELLHFKAKVSSAPSDTIFENNSLLLDTTNLSSLTDKVIKITLTPLETGRFTIKPKIVYTDENGKSETTYTNPITITIEDNQNSTTTKQPRIEFKSQPSQTVFQYLVKSFNDDTQRKLSPERAGWRTLMDIVKDCGVSKHSVYNSARKHGTVISELEGSKLIEAKLFSGERGRGGDVLKVRIAYEKEQVLNYVNRAEK